MVSLGRPLVWCISSPSCHQRQFGPVLKTASFSFALSWSSPSQRKYFTFSHWMLIRIGWSADTVFEKRSENIVFNVKHRKHCECCPQSQFISSLWFFVTEEKSQMKVPKELSKTHNYWRSSMVSSQITLVNQICGYGVLHEDDSVSSVQALQVRTRKTFGWRKSVSKKN